MKNISHIRDFTDAVIAWASTQSDIQAIGLVGSYARSQARDDSDIDFVILTEQPAKYVNSTEWVEQFGAIAKHQTEDYGKLTSVRVWYRDGYEVEYGISAPDWASLPLDPGTEEVISDGMILLLERGNLLSDVIRSMSF